MLSLRHCRCTSATRRTAARSPVKVHSAAVGGPVATRPLLLHAGETTLSIPFSADKAQQLQAAFQQLFQTFSEKQKAQRPKRWDMMEWRHDEQDNGIEVFCNPNAHANAFDAKLLITLWSHGGLKVTTEARLTAVTTDLDLFLQG